MIVNTCFNNKSEHGYPSKVLKSGICKYMRRNESNKLKWCIMEMALFHDHPKGGGLITNLINRLKILLMEEISPIDIGIIVEGIDLLEKYDKNRGQRELLLKFSDLVSSAKKGRMVSYLGNWWKNKHESHEFVNNNILKSEKYKKKEDSDYLLNLGDSLIDLIEKKDEKMFGIFAKMYHLEKMGSRFRRKDGIYLWWEILADYISDEKIKKIYDFALSMFHKRGLTERFAFGIWIGMFLWREDKLNFYCPKLNNYSENDVKEYYQKMESMEIDDYVINDYHVNKKYGLGHFSQNGALVLNEDCSILDNPEIYKEFYIKIKLERDEKNKKKIKLEKKKENVKIDKDISFIKKQISFNKFSDVEVLEKGVCSGKKCCIKVNYKGKNYILKEMSKNMNYGADYIIIDKCKKSFGLRDMNMKIIKSDKGLDRKDNGIKSYVNNWQIVEREVIYSMMDFWENIGDLGNNKKYLKNKDVVKECMKIRLFDGLFCSSDNILRNILINEKGELLSIDEGDMFGKRKNIFNKNEWCKSKNISDDIINEVLDELLNDGGKKKELVLKKMDKYGLNYKSKFEKRFDNYRNIVENEWLCISKN